MIPLGELASNSVSSWIIPLRSLKSIKTSPPKSRFLDTHPCKITSSPTLFILNNIPNKIEKNKATFNTKDGAGSTSRKKVRIIEELKKANTTGKAVVDLSGDNIIDRAGNKLSLEADSATETCQYFYDNAIPDIEINVIGESTGNSYNPTANDWIKEPVTIIVTANDII